VDSETTIEPGESLYRGLDAGCYEGSVVLPRAIDLQGSSVYRGTMVSPADVLAMRQKSERVAETKRERLAWTVEHPETKVPWECFVVPETSIENKKAGTPLKKLLQDAVAASMIVLPIVRDPASGAA
jgi:hypothetical protein